MRKGVSKALYLYLCSILGMVLLAMLHRSIFVLYELLLTMDFNTYSLGLTTSTIMALDFFTLLAALFFGGWYGTVLGLDWYARVYGSKAENPGSLFHGFIPHNWRGSSKPSKPASKTISNIAPEATTTTTVVNVPVTPKPTREWTFEELLAPPKPAAKRKTARKSTAKKTTAKRTTKAKE